MRQQGTRPTAKSRWGHQSFLRDSPQIDERYALVCLQRVRTGADTKTHRRRTVQWHRSGTESARRVACALLIYARAQATACCPAVLPEGEVATRARRRGATARAPRQAVGRRSATLKRCREQDRREAARRAVAKRFGIPGSPWPRETGHMTDANGLGMHREHDGDRLGCPSGRLDLGR